MRMAWCAAAPGDGKYDFLDRMFDHTIVENSCNYRYPRAMVLETFRRMNSTGTPP
jgi:hypothetical protein